MKKIVLGLASFCLVLAVSAQNVSRPSEPIVLQGSEFPQYANELPSDMVAFKYLNGNWIQIPIQIDERELKDIVSGYGPLATNQFPPSPSNPKILFYSDANTYIGADTNSFFDADDELVFMMKDAGSEFTGTALPNGVVDGSCTQIKILDPLPGGGTWYVYLFKQDGSLQPGAGINYVSLTTNVSSVAGWPAHANGVNPENTTISTNNYSWHISSEWVSDELKLVLGTDVDVLDRHKNFFANGTCVRTEDTFSDAENAYLVSKVGPIRAIRSIMGANSGPLTQRTHLFYETRLDIATDLRVHSIPSVYDAFDYSPAANGMVYSNNINGNTTAVVNGTGTGDGLSVSGVLEWEQVTGSQGTVSIIHKSITNINSVPSDNTTFLAYYNDNSSSPASNCTGDGQAWGTSGWGATFAGGITTDPITNAGASNLRYLQATRFVYPEAPNQTMAPLHAFHHTYPLYITTAACAVGSSLTANISATPILCSGGMSTITVTTGNNSGPLHYAWAHDAGLQGNTATVPAGLYQVTVSDDHDTIPLSITVADGDTINLNVQIGNNNLTVTAMESNAQYAWFNCNTHQLIPGANGQSYTTAVYSPYAAIITNQNGCVDTTACYYVGSVSIHENELATQISVYPNPSSENPILFITSDDINDLSYILVDITGRTITSQKIMHKQTLIPIEGLAEGVYIIHVRKGKQDVKAIRFIKN